MNKGNDTQLQHEYETYLHACKMLGRSPVSKADLTAQLLWETKQAWYSRVNRIKPDKVPMDVMTGEIEESYFKD